MTLRKLEYRFLLVFIGLIMISCKNPYKSQITKNQNYNSSTLRYPSNQYYKGRYYPYYPSYGGISLEFYNSIKKYHADSMLHSNCSSPEKDTINKSLNFTPGIIQAKIEIDSISVIVHLINATDSSIKFIVQSGNIPMIREALDESGKWRPIEYWLLNWCGFGYRNDSLKSNEQFIVRTFLYGGSYNTEIRFKLLLNNHVLYSDYYKGQINRNQFIVTTPWNYYDIYRSFLN